MNIFFTWANLITIIRFLLILYFSYSLIVNNNLLTSFWLLLILSATDWLDGYIARALNQVSYWGSILDPFVDRLGLIIIIISTIVVGIAPIWLIYTIVIPDIIIFCFSIFFLKLNINLHVTYIGKMRTALLFIGVPMLILNSLYKSEYMFISCIAHLLLISGCIGHWIAGFQYFQQCLKQYNTKSL